MHERLGATVSVRARTPDRGQIIIEYRSVEELERLAGFFQLEAPAGLAMLDAPSHSS
jgi:hypothetical protein